MATKITGNIDVLCLVIEGLVYFVSLQQQIAVTLPSYSRTRGKVSKGNVELIETVQVPSHDTLT